MSPYDGNFLPQAHISELERLAGEMAAAQKRVDFALEVLASAQKQLHEFTKAYVAERAKGRKPSVGATPKGAKGMQP